MTKQNVEVFPDDFLEEHCKVLDNVEDAISSYMTMQSDVILQKILSNSNDKNDKILLNYIRQATKCQLKEFHNNSSRTHRRRLKRHHSNQPEELHEHSSGNIGGHSQQVPKKLEKHVVVYNYQNVCGLCNPSSAMFAQYLHFTMNNLNELKHGDPVNVYGSSLFPSVNVKLYYGDTVGALHEYCTIALSVDSDANSFQRNHEFTHLNVLTSNVLDINYGHPERYDDDISLYKHENKEEIFKNYIETSTGVFKVLEHEHASCLWLGEDMAIYVNNSLLTPEPLVCKKTELVDNWKKLVRWNRSQFGQENPHHVPLFDVIVNLKKFEFDNNSNVVISMSGGKHGENTMIKTISIILGIVALFAIVILIVVVISKVHKHETSGIVP